MLLIEDIWNLSQGLNIYIYRHVYREGNITVDYLAIKGLSSLDSSVLWSNFSKDVTNISFYDKLTLSKVKEWDRGRRLES